MKNKTLVILLVLGIILSGVGSIVTFLEFSQIEITEEYNENMHLKKTYQLNPNLNHFEVNQLGYENVLINYRQNGKLDNELNLYLKKEYEPYIDLKFENNTLTINTEEISDFKQAKQQFKTILSNLKEKKINMSELDPYILVIEANPAWHEKILVN